ncbi:MAG: PEP-CTERM sorting domain-containing protein [Microcystaceae cyanobacterium]
MNKIKSTQIKAFSFGASIFTLATILGSTQNVNAATFNFSFTNVEGPVSGTVEGTIELPDGDGTFAATSVIVNSAPPALGYTTPFDVFATFAIELTNSFTVVSGEIDALASSFGVAEMGEAFVLNFSTTGSVLSLAGSGFTSSGVRDTDNSTLIYSSVPTATTPEPSAILGLLAVGSLGALTRKRK